MPRDRTSHGIVANRPNRPLAQASAGMTGAKSLAPMASMAQFAPRPMASPKLNPMPAAPPQLMPKPPQWTPPIGPNSGEGSAVGQGPGGNGVGWQNPKGNFAEGAAAGAGNPSPQAPGWGSPKQPAKPPSPGGEGPAEGINPQWDPKGGTGGGAGGPGAPAWTPPQPGEAQFQPPSIGGFADRYRIGGGGWTNVDSGPYFGSIPQPPGGMILPPPIPPPQQGQVVIPGTIPGTQSPGGETLLPGPGMQPAPTGPVT
jgi:hypothetical protein